MEDKPQIIGNKLLLDGYVYIKSKTVKEKTYWDCRRLRQKQCTARAITNQERNGDLVVIKGPSKSPHQHPPNREETGAEVVKSHIKSRAEQCPEIPPAQLLRNELKNVPSGVLCLLPERENLKKSLRRDRRKNLPPNPKSLQDLAEIPERFQKTLAGDRFLVFDSREAGEEDEENRVLFFTTRRNLEILAKCSTWYVDGTFKVCPGIFAQVFTIIGTISRGGTDAEVIPLPLVFSLLSSKEQSQYVTVLQSVVDVAREYRIAGCSPVKIMTDFEKGIINAAMSVFPRAHISCCFFFHLGQTLYRKIQEEGLQQQYNDPDNREVKVHAHMILALAFVPPADVKECFEKLRDEVPDKLVPVMDFFEENYVVGRPARGRRPAVPARYPINTWNQHEATVMGQHKTNNLSEGWHNRFRIVVAKHHPDLYSALTEFQKEQADTETTIAEFNMGRSVKAAPKKKWVNLQNRIRAITNEYETYKTESRTVDFLRNVAYNVAMRRTSY